jgi:tetratricopeptide (TPR) repeat protein
MAGRCFPAAPIPVLEQFILSIMENPAKILEDLRASWAADRSDPRAASRLAEHYGDLGWFNEAEEVYRDALALSGDDYFLLLSYGNACYRRAAWTQALEVFLKLTRLMPGRVEGWNNAGMAFVKIGNFGDAAGLFRTMLAIEPDNPGALLNLGNCHAARGELAEAAKLFKRAIAVSPDCADAWYNLGNTHLSQKEYPEARASFERALRYRPEFPSALKNLGVAFEFLNENDRAFACFRKAAELGRTDSGAYVNLARACCSRDEIGEAKGYFLKAVRLEPRSVDAWLGLSTIALMKGDVAACLRCMLAIIPNLSAGRAVRCARILLELGRPREALQVLDAAKKQSLCSDELDALRHDATGQCGEEGDRVAVCTGKGA